MTGTTSAYLAAPGRQELPALTGLRIFAALGVAVWHASVLLPSLPVALAHGYLGVDLFFMLSGFIIAHVYWDDFAAARRGSARRFVALRLARIWPAHMAVIAVFAMAVLAAMLAGRVGEMGFGYVALELLLQALLLQNLLDEPLLNYPSWSVSAEFIAYLCFPLVVALVARLRSAAALLAGVPAALLLCFLLQTVLLGQPLGTGGPAAFIRVLCEFAAGVMLWRLWRGGHLAAVPWRIVLPLCLLAALAVAALSPPRHHLDYLIVLLLAPLLPGLAQGGSGLARVLAWRPLVYLGEISYSVYLAHVPAIILTRFLALRLEGVFGGRQAGADIFLLALLLSLAGGATLFHVVEKPARLWLRARIDRHLPAPAAQALQATPT